jgi:hypothetical protein
MTYITDDVLSDLERLAEGECWTDDPDFNPCDFSGGNFDDAYWAGFNQGQTKLAQSILETIKETK